MPEWESEFLGKPIQDLRGTLTTLRRTGAMRVKRVRRFVRWFVRGVIVGAVWAMLFAPQSGAETRQAVGKLLRPLVEISTTALRTWRRYQKHTHQDELAAKRARGEDCTSRRGGDEQRG